MANQKIDNLVSTIFSHFHNGSLAFWDEDNELESYKIVQFHLHAPSEHSFDGKLYDAELHLVHKHTHGRDIAVVAVFFDLEAGGDSDNEFIAALNLTRL